MPVIPQPQKVTWYDGSFPLATLPLQCYWPERIDTLAFGQMRSQLSGMNLEFHRSKLSKANFLCGLIPDLNNFQDLNDDIKATLDHPIGDEGYHLMITPRNIMLLAETPAGLYYGVQTFRQLLQAYGNSGRLPCLTITDYPRFAFRGIMDDISRGPIPNMAFMKDQIQRLSELKINYLNFYIEHVVRLPGHEGFAPEEGITPEQWQELSEYAGRRNVHLIGGFQSLGHARSVLSNPEYSHLGLSDRMYRPADPEVTGFLVDVYAKMLPVFNSSYFNINCDEAYDLGMTPDLNRDEAYLQHVLPLLSYLSGRGKRPMIWGDMLAQMPHLLGELPPNTVVLPWNYDPGADLPSLIRPVRERGLDFIACPGILNSNRLLPEFDQALANIREFAAAADTLGALGVMTTVWDDGGHSFFTNDWYGVAFAGAQSWHLDTLSRDQFDRHYSRSWMGDPSQLLPGIIRTLNRLAHQKPTRSMTDRVLFQRIIPSPGETLGIDTTDWQAVQDIASEAVRLAEMLERTAYDGSHAQWDQPYWRFLAELYLALAETRSRFLQMREDYEAAALLCASAPDSSNQLLNCVIRNCLELNAAWEDLATDLEALWIRENRPYWLDTIAIVYRERAHRMQEVLGSNLVLGALNDKADGSNWFVPQVIGLDAAPTPHPFLTYWLLAGPFPAEDSGSARPDFLVSRSGEPAAAPSPTARYLLPNGMITDWEKHQAPLADWVDLKSFYGVDSSFTAYGACRLDSEERKLVDASLSYDGALTVWLNGNIVFEDDRKENPAGRGKTLTLPLQKGNNHLLLRLTGNAYQWRFAIGLPHRELSNRKYKYDVR